MYKKINLFISILILITVSSKTQSSKILGVFAIPWTSHYMAANTLMRILAEKGHEVTMVSVIEEKNPPENFKQVVLEGVYQDFMTNISTNIFDSYSSNPFLVLAIGPSFSSNCTEKLFGDKGFQNLMNSDEQFDVVILEDFMFDAMKYISYHFKAPLIVYSSLDAVSWINAYQGNPDSPSYTPVQMLGASTCDMTFFERTLNTIIYVGDYLCRNLIMIPQQNTILHKYYPDAPNLKDIIYNVSLAFLNADPSVQESLPRVPSMINIGGFHIKKPKALPKDILDVIESSKAGVILFTLGSTVKSKDMPADKLKILLNSFSKLNQTVLWKYEDQHLEGCPKNVILRKWLPQNDILGDVCASLDRIWLVAGLITLLIPAHKNVKLFITHGGLFSTMEAVYHGVPILALPVFADQLLNSKRAMNNRIGKFIPFYTIEEKEFATDIQEILDDAKYKENALKMSRIMLDKPLTPAESVNYWVEYVIRHKGAPHLRVSSLNLSWYQHLLLDVALFLLMSFIAFFYFTKLIFKRLHQIFQKKEKMS